MYSALTPAGPRGVRAIAMQSVISVTIELHCPVTDAQGMCPGAQCTLSHFYANLETGRKRRSKKENEDTRKVSWCLKPGQSRRIISGLRETVIKRYILERTNKAKQNKKTGRTD